MNHVKKLDFPSNGGPVEPEDIYSMKDIAAAVQVSLVIPDLDVNVWNFLKYGLRWIT
jgi:hypothetical protein